MEELKRCPFCGGKAKMTEPRSKGEEIRVRIYCTSCKTTSFWNWQAEAIAAWNRRTQNIGEDECWGQPEEQEV